VVVAEEVVEHHAEVEGNSLGIHTSYGQ
jgi:hypothetical protein